jgi:hypothetical protein
MVDHERPCIENADVFDFRNAPCQKPGRAARDVLASPGDV